MLGSLPIKWLNPPSFENFFLESFSVTFKVRSDDFSRRQRLTPSL